MFLLKMFFTGRKKKKKIILKIFLHLSFVFITISSVMFVLFRMWNKWERNLVELNLII